MPKQYRPVIQCGSCNNYFHDVAAFDAHRTGYVNNRKCVDPKSLGMIRNGTVVDTEVWMLPVE